jgi:hypothetical protein
LQRAKRIAGEKSNQVSIRESSIKASLGSARLATAGPGTAQQGIEAAGRLRAATSNKKEDMKTGFKLPNQSGTVEQVKVSSLKFDPAIYPRAWHSDEQVAQLQDAVAAGATLPPIIVDIDTMRIVDGVHRWKRAQNAGDETILAELRNFETEQDVFETAIAANARHGYGYFEIDREHIYRRATSLNLSVERIAKALCCTVEKVEAITRGFVKVEMPGPIQPRAEKPKTRNTSAIRAHQGNSRREIPPPMETPGANQMAYVNHLIVAVSNGRIDYRQDRITYALHNLAELIKAKVPVHPPVKEAASL